MDAILICSSARISLRVKIRQETGGEDHFTVSLEVGNGRMLVFFIVFDAIFQ